MDKSPHLVTFDPLTDKSKLKRINSNERKLKTIESSIEIPEIDISAFLENVVRLFEKKRKQRLLKMVFKEWVRGYYEASIKNKAIEIELMKKHNYL